MIELIPLAIGNTLMLGLFAISFGLLPPEIPLYFSHTWGDSQLGTKWEILLLPLVMNLLFFAIYFYGRKMVDRDSLEQKNVLFWTNISQIILVCVAYVRIVLVLIW